MPLACSIEFHRLPSDATPMDTNTAESVPIHGSFAGMEGPIFSCEDMEFFATAELVTIIPNFSGNRLSCISVSSIPLACLLSPTERIWLQGDFGPFMPSVPAQVPLFIALQLRQSGKCRIQPPEWLEKGKTFPLS